MAYSGNKLKHVDLLKSLELSPGGVIVDPFFGSGSLTQAFMDAVPGSGKLIVGAELFAPLRDLHSKCPDLDSLADRILLAIDRDGIHSTWQSLRNGLRLVGPWTPAQAFVGLNNLSIGNSMRHGPQGHNVKPCVKKVEALRKRGALISPIAISPDLMYRHWLYAVESSGGNESVLLLDPPYIGSQKIYPFEDPSKCAIPPVGLGMQRQYKQIIAFNYWDELLDAEFGKCAESNGYSMESRPTGWKTRFKPGKGKKVEYVWVFRNLSTWGSGNV